MAVGKDATKWQFGTDKRKGIMTGSLSPGPGAYSTKPVAFEHEKPRFFMGEKLKDLKPNTNVPGSGEYNPVHTATKKAGA